MSVGWVMMMVVVVVAVVVVIMMMVMMTSDVALEQPQHGAIERHTYINRCNIETL